MPVLAGCQSHSSLGDCHAAIKRQHGRGCWSRTSAASWGYTRRKGWLLFHSLFSSLALCRHSHIGNELELLCFLLSAWTPKPPWSVIRKVGWWWPTYNTDIYISLADVSPLLECYISEWTAGHFYLKKMHSSVVFTAAFTTQELKSYSESGQKWCGFFFFFTVSWTKSSLKILSLFVCLLLSLSPSLCFSLQFWLLPLHIHFMTSLFVAFGYWASIYRGLQWSLCSHSGC